MGIISKITLPNGDTHALRDSLASHYIGVTTTAITDGGTVSAITIADKSVTPVYDDVVMYNDLLFINTSGTWKQLTFAPPAADVTDVQVDGATVVSSGVASIVTKNGDYNASSNKLVTESDIEDLPQAMIFRGTLGTGGTITTLPTASATTAGDVYKVITKGTYAQQAAEVGDVFICSQSGQAPQILYSWVLVPSGDEPSGTVTNVATGIGLTGGPITDTGTIKVNVKSETSIGTIGSTDVLAVGVDDSGKLGVVAKQETDGTYNASTNKLATVSTVTTAINNITDTLTGNPAASKTITAFGQQNGGVVATFENISIPISQVNDVTATTTINNPTAVTVAKTVVASASSVTNEVTYYNYTAATETLSLYKLGYTTGDSINGSEVANVVVKQTS